ncbi:hypothetical protein CVN68_18815 [Sphingomonas psychrotolerans]|uniref:Uncharacterized protein n=1 Tax=Sphingomonas psychrotolerans TaxID=1327635 RepID=A0A2K8MLN2_9SPHN|nr:hypothetical protein CVN68_18815 [Sphingomonas psychrotolerans]
MGLSPWFWAGVVAAVYCAARGIVDLRRRSYWWGVLGLTSAIIILLTPNPNNAVTATIKIDLPAGAQN